LSDSRFRARPVDVVRELEHLERHGVLEPVDAGDASATERTVPTSVRSAWPASRPSMRLLRMDVISSGLICMVAFGGSW
jgi:hypothetical protein